jgi:hypothetical protein
MDGRTMRTEIGIYLFHAYDFYRLKYDIELIDINAHISGRQMDKPMQ